MSGESIMFRRLGFSHKILNYDIVEINLLNEAGVESLQSTLGSCADLQTQMARLRRWVGDFRI